MTSTPLAHHAPCGLVAISSDDELIDANPVLAGWLEADPAELAGVPLSRVFTPAAMLFFESRVKQVLRLQREARDVALSIRTGDGGELPVLAHFDLAEDGITYAALFDATGRRDFERELVRTRREAEAAAARVRVLQEASIALSAAPTEERLAEVLAAHARDAFAAVRAAVLLVGPDGRPRLLGGDDVEDAAWWPVMEVITGTGDVVVESLDDAERHPGLVDSFRRARIEALSATPISHEGVDLGVLVCMYGRRRPADAVALELQRALATLAAEVLTRLRLQRRLEYFALHDPLTGLANRTGLLGHVAEAIEGTRESGKPFALVFVDLDAFKQINDEYGHVVGDQVLVEVARRIRSAIRDDDAAGRFGGDEFVIVVRDADESAAHAVADRIREALAAHIHPLEHRVTASIGVAMFTGPRAGLTADALLGRADAAMYAAKAAGKDAVRFW